MNKYGIHGFAFFHLKPSEYNMYWDMKKNVLLIDITWEFAGIRRSASSPPLRSTDSEF